MRATLPFNGLKFLWTANITSAKICLAHYVLPSVFVRPTIFFASNFFKMLSLKWLFETSGKCIFIYLLKTDLECKLKIVFKLSLKVEATNIDLYSLVKWIRQWVMMLILFRYGFLQLCVFSRVNEVVRRLEFKLTEAVTRRCSRKKRCS